MTGHQPSNCMREELFYRLRWRLFCPQGEIEIEEGMDENGEIRRAPFLSHPVASEAATEPPVSSMRVSSVDVQNCATFRMIPADTEHTLLLFENADGTPITMRDFVTHVHDHLDQYKQLLLSESRLRVGGDIGDESPAVLFKNATGSTIEGRAYVNIFTFAARDDRDSREKIWAIQRRQAAALLHPPDMSEVMQMQMAMFARRQETQSEPPH